MCPRISAMIFSGGRQRLLITHEHLTNFTCTCCLPDVTRIASRQDVASWASALLRPRFLNARSRPTDVTCFAEHPLHNRSTTRPYVSSHLEKLHPFSSCVSN